MNKLNKLWIGLALGMLFPLIILVIVYFASYRGISFSDFIKITTTYQIFTQIVSICVVPNIGIFFFFTKRNLLLGARGVLIATFVYLILILIYKVV
ncbi:MAG: hypothetical protein A2W91_15270 [Bacteroidetes bacterium GWF2_38_335]|nr:MAG: hypothetical protein A2W91_15270 [Bacteroidetes bacterium GWF2_38_335]OFY81061.1 MAG: hypothetical protein A2281_13210 [Bacteroidetes bacterium RIFOXYA12_FULL_38_20]HBS87622.1 hypothetical protein [Bacteroidales bacterium]